MARLIRTTQADVDLDAEAAHRWIDRVRRFIGVPTSDSPRHAGVSIETAAEVGRLQHAMEARGATPAATVTAIRDLLNERGPEWAAREADNLLHQGASSD